MEQVVGSFPTFSDSIRKISLFVSISKAEDRTDASVPAYPHFPAKSRNFFEEALR